MFEWQTEEKNWEEETEKGQTAVRKRPKRFWLLLVLLLLAGASFVIYRQVNQQIAQTVTNTEQTVLASYELLRTAVASGDHELVYSLLSGSEPAWTETQIKLSHQGLLFNREFFRLQMVNENGQNPQVTLSPDLNEAVVVVEQQFVVMEEEQEQKVKLQQTAVFRQGSQRWLYAPPTDEFWGPWHYSPNDWLSVTYPQRDEEISLRLAADLRAKLQQMCQVLADLSCPDDLHITLRLERDVAIFLERAEPFAPLVGSQSIILPTPTLVGLPVDEAGYQALFRGYAEQLLSQVITDLNDWACCNFHLLFYQGLLYEQLDQLGVRPFPLTAAHYETVLTQGTTLGSLNVPWAVPFFLSPDSAAWASMMAVTQFMLRQEPTLSPAMMQQQLGTHENFWSWLERWLHGQGFRANSDLGRAALERDWLQFVYERSTVAQSPPPIPLPTQTVQLMCGFEGANQNRLYRYDLSRQMWQTDMVDRPLLGMYPLPQDEGVLLMERFFAPGDRFWQNRFIWWHDEQETVLLQSPLSEWWGAYPSLPETPFFHILSTFQEANGVRYLVHSINLETCEAGSCQVEVFSGVPISSPDVPEPILWDGNRLYQESGSEESHTSLVDGVTAAFAVREGVIGYVQTASGSPEQVIYLLENGRSTPLLTQSQLFTAFDPAAQPENLYIAYVVPHPTASEKLLVAASNLSDITPKVYLFLVEWMPTTVTQHDRYTSQAVLLLEADDQFATYPPLQFSSNGRWLTMTTDSFRHPARTLYLHDLIANETQTLSAPNTFLRYDWSADGEWLLRSEEGYLSLYAPAYRHRRLIFHDYGECPFVAWVK